MKEFTIKIQTEDCVTEQGIVDEMLSSLNIDLSAITVKEQTEFELRIPDVEALKAADLLRSYIEERSAQPNSISEQVLNPMMKVVRRLRQLEIL